MMMMSLEGHKNLQLPLSENESVSRNHQDSSAVASHHQHELVVPTETHVVLNRSTDEGELPSATRSPNSRPIANEESYGAFLLESLSMQSTIGSFSNNDQYCEETVSIYEGLRVQDDGGSEEPCIIRCASDGRYFKLDDRDTRSFVITMMKSLPCEKDPRLWPKYQFSFIVSNSVARAGFLKVSSWYLTLDTNDSPPKKLKLVSGAPPEGDSTALVHRGCANGYCSLYFEYANKFFELKPNENGVLAVEERSSVSECKAKYTMIKYSRSQPSS